MSKKEAELKRLEEMFIEAKRALEAKKIAAELAFGHEACVLLNSVFHAIHHLSE